MTKPAFFKRHAEWQKQVIACARELVDIDDLFADDDPYDIAALSRDAFDKGQSPEDFVREAFEEDIAGKAYDDDLRRQGEESAAGER